MYRFLFGAVYIVYTVHCTVDNNYYFFGFWFLVFGLVGGVYESWGTFCTIDIVLKCLSIVGLSLHMYVGAFVCMCLFVCVGCVCGKDR